MKADIKEEKMSILSLLSLLSSIKETEMLIVWPFSLFTVGSTAPQSGLRPIVIDGSNVAMSHGRSHTFSVRGIQLVIDFFRERGHQKIVAFLPEFRKKASMSSDPV